MDKPIRRTVGICVGHSLKTRPMEFYSPCEVEPYIAYLEKRAEEAESSLDSCLITVARYAGPRTSDRDRAEVAAAEAKHQLGVNVVLSRHNQAIADQRDKALNQLSELARQEPEYFLNRIESSDKWGPETDLRIYESQLDASKSKDDHGGGIIELFTRPAPAAVPVDLVPVAIPKEVYKVIYDECGGFVETTANAQHIWECCRMTILSLIDGGSKS